jgi:hypothetical protein
MTGKMALPWDYGILKAMNAFKKAGFPDFILSLKLFLIHP